jgi:poly-gamma-glutamate capsule biosynthesis protein CapA/YwtB (metallophosphatase superfamily)
LARTRFGAALLVLGAVLVWLHSRGLEPLAIALQAGALGAVLGAAFVAGSAADRGALTTALTHPTTPLAIATGRWLAAAAPAAALAIACTAITGWHASAAASGIAAAAAVGSCALVVVLTAGNGAAVALFLFMAVAGAVAPEELVRFAHPGVMRLAAASALELGPALWHYRDVAAGEAGAILHASAWAGFGIVLASGLVARRRRLL